MRPCTSQKPSDDPAFTYVRFWWFLTVRERAVSSIPLLYLIKYNPVICFHTWKWDNYQNSHIIIVKMHKSARNASRNGGTVPRSKAPSPRLLLFLYSKYWQVLSPVCNSGLPLRSGSASPWCGFLSLKRKGPDLWEYQSSKQYSFFFLYLFNSSNNFRSGRSLRPMRSKVRIIYKIMTFSNWEY